MYKTQLRQHTIMFLKVAIDDGKRDMLKNDIDSLIPVLSAAAASADIHNGFDKDIVNDLLAQGEYSKLVQNNYFEFEFNNYVPTLLKQYKNTKTDIEYGFLKDKQIEVLKNSIKFFQYLIEYMECDQHIATKYLDISKEILTKLDGPYQQTNPILKYLKNSKMNYIMYDEMFSYHYPFVVDILLDTFRLECAVNIDVDLTDAICSLNFDSREKLSSLDSFLFPRVDFLDEIDRDEIQSFILSIYHNTLQCEYSDIKSIYKQLLYYIPGDHKRDFKDKEDISKIPTKIYLRHFSSLIL